MQKKLVNGTNLLTLGKNKKIQIKQKSSVILFTGLFCLVPFYSSKNNVFCKILVLRML